MVPTTSSRNLKPDQGILDEDTAKDLKARPWDPKVTVEAPQRREGHVRRGRHRREIESRLRSSDLHPRALCPWPTTRAIAFMFVVTDPTADVDTVQAEVQKVAEAANPLANVQSNQEVIDDISGQINSVVYPLYALLAVIVVISIVGIINTLLLSVFERTREIGTVAGRGHDPPPGAADGALRERDHLGHRRHPRGRGRRRVRRHGDLPHRRDPVRLPDRPDHRRSSSSRSSPASWRRSCPPGGRRGWTCWPPCSTSDDPRPVRPDGLPGSAHRRSAAGCSARSLEISSRLGPVIVRP